MEGAAVEGDEAESEEPGSALEEDVATDDTIAEETTETGDDSGEDAGGGEDEG